jgi:hypothetical protein
MGRGLSHLQRKILCLALIEKFVTCEEILTKVWDWQPPKQGPEKTTTDKAKYASAHAALSRSLTRLWARDLITYWRTLTHYRTGITLTDHGIELARSILAEAEKTS